MKGKVTVMKRKDMPKRSITLTVRVTQDEYEKSFAVFKKSTCRNFTQFLRNRLIGQPETVFYRNQSADDFLLVAIELKDQLNALMKHFNEMGSALQESNLLSFGLLVEEIKTRLNQIYEQWLQK